MFHRLALCLTALAACFACGAAIVDLKPGILVRDQFPAPFVRNVMPGAPRSIAIPLGSNVNVAFDAQLLRVHTAWIGAPARLSGYPTGGTDPVTHVSGSILWSAPAVVPWTRSTPGGETNRFRGISTKGGKVTLLYDIADRRGFVRIHETPSLALAGTNAVIKRRFELARGTDGLRFAAFADTGIFVTNTAHAAALRRSNDLVVVIHNGIGVLTTNRSGNGAVRIVIDLPADMSTNAQAFELLTLVLPSNTVPATMIAQLSTNAPAPADPGPVYRIASHGPGRALEFRGAAQPGRVDGADYYRREQVPVPKELDLLVGGMDWLPNGDLAVATWPGEIYVALGITNSVTNIVWRRFATGLHEPLGIKWLGASAVVATKAELTRLSDTDGDGMADLYETVADAWGFDGDVHYFAYGPAMDNAGSFYVTLDGNTGDWHARWPVPLRGWAVKVRPDGVTEPLMPGLRSPNGVFAFNGDIFCTDNEGYWMGWCKVNHCRPGKFCGYPSSTPHPHEGFDKPDHFDPPAIWFPRKLATSASGGEAVNDARFGPFTNQLFVGDFGLAGVQRVALEKVNGEWQGAVWPFERGFLSGVNRLRMGPDGRLYVGSLRRAWGSAGPQEFALERLTFTGRAPFEARAVKALPSGFEITFTGPVEAAGASDTNAWAVSQFNYRYSGKYGSPEYDQNGKENSATPIAVTAATVSPDKMSVRLQLSGLKTGYITAVTAKTIRGPGGALLWHDTFYYTLNELPK